MAGVVTPHPPLMLRISRRPLPQGEVREAHAFSFSRAEPRGLQRAEGARAPKRCDLVMLEAAFRRPRAVVLPGRGCNIIVSGPQVPPGGFKGPGYRRSGPLAAALLDCLSRAATEGRPCTMLPPMHSLDRRPRNLRRAFSSRRRCERKATPPQPGTDLAPHQTLSCCVPRIGQDEGQYGGGLAGGDKFAQFRCKNLDNRLSRLATSRVSHDQTIMVFQPKRLSSSIFDRSRRTLAANFANQNSVRVFGVVDCTQPACRC